MAVNKLTDIDRYGREGRINDDYEPPVIEEFKEKEHLRSWLADADCRDQFIMYRGDNVGVYWNEKDDPPKNEVDRQHWTERFVMWSPMGTYLASMHVKGVLLWGGKSWNRLKRFQHPGVDLVDFSPNENFLTTWSHRPVTVEEGDPILTAEEEGKSYIVWDIATGKPIRSFNNIEPPGPSVDADGNPIKKKLQWPAFKWSADDKYVARMNPGQGVSVFELPKMNLMDKTSVKIDGIVDFEWSPSTPQRDGVRTYEQIFCYWTPEQGSIPAKVGLMSIPSREIVRTRNLFNVADAKLHWQSQSKFVCVKVDRQKTKKSFATNLEIFRLKEKGVPVEVVDSIKDRVINFQWEPSGDRFVLITAGDDAPAATTVPPKTSVSFFCPEKPKGGVLGNFKHISTQEKRNCNAIYWSPKGRFVVVGTIASNQSYELDFWDFDYEGEKDEKDKDLSANLQLMTTADHYSVTELEWDPTGRYVTSSASIWRNAMETGYHLYDFKGQLLYEEHVDRFKQWLWRPRPPTLLSKEEQKQVRKNLREYSKIFEVQDLAKKNQASAEEVERRKRLLEEWYSWRQGAKEDLREQREAMGLPADRKDEEEDLGGDEVVEEWVEELIEEKEEVIG